MRYNPLKERLGILDTFLIENSHIDRIFSIMLKLKHLCFHLETKKIVFVLETV